MPVQDARDIEGFRQPFPQPFHQVLHPPTRRRLLRQQEGSGAHRAVARG